jgi:integrase/ribosomal protein L32
MTTEDPQNFRGRLARQRELLTESEAVADADRDAIRRFLRRKDGTVAVSTLKTYLRRIRKAAEYSDVPLVALDEDAYRDLVFELRHDESLGRGGTMSDATLKSYEDCLCQFLEAECDREWAADVERTTVERQPVDPETMLGPEDIEALISAARYQRDVALIEFLADTAARISLVCSLRISDVDLEGERATYTPNPDALGLKGAPIKPYPIIDSKASLRSYLRTAHPAPDEPEAPLFHKLRRYQADGEDPALAPAGLQNHFRRLGDRAGLDKPVHPHNFRHSAITRMVREGYTRAQIQHRVHWTLDTDMWDRYVHLEAEELNNDIFAAAGVVDDVEAASPQRNRCGNCGEQLAAHHRHCPACGVATSHPRRNLLRAVDDALVEQLASTDDHRQREELFAIREALNDDPSMIPDLITEHPDIADAISRHL